MGNPKQKWTQEEEQALRDGVAKYGPGKWKSIHNDPAFANVLHSRSNIDLKDKWRNLSAAAQGLSTSRSRTPKLKLNQDAPVTPVPLLTLTASPDPAPVPLMTVQPSPVTPVLQKPATNNVKEEPVKDITDAKNASSDQIGLVFEALAAEPNGLDIASIVSYIEKKIGVESQPNFRKQLGAKLRRLHQQGKIDKGKTGYKLPKSPLVETISSNRKDIPPPSKLSLEDLAKTAACKVAEAEEKTHSAAKSVLEAEKYSKMLEESEARVQLCQEIYDKSHNSEVLVA